LRLFDTVGQIAWSGAARTQAGLNILEINDLSSLPAGNYFLNVQVPAGEFSRVVAIGK
jgi:hypothetical protein